jgi:hypothetical protein
MWRAARGCIRAHARERKSRSAHAWSRQRRSRDFQLKSWWCWKAPQRFAYSPTLDHETRRPLPRLRGSTKCRHPWPSDHDRSPAPSPPTSSHLRPSPPPDSTVVPLNTRSYAAHARHARTHAAIVVHPAKMISVLGCLWGKPRRLPDRDVNSFLVTAFGCANYTMLCLFGDGRHGNLEPRG